MSSVVIDRKLAFSVAQRYAPIIYQEISDIRDFILPIQYGPNDKQVEASLGNLITNRCTLYFGVREDEKFYYCYYLVYHPFDWSSNKIDFLRKLDEHRHDTESILYRISKDEKETIDAVTVAHYLFYFEGEHNRKVTIERESHAIHSWSERSPRGNYIKYVVHELIDLNQYIKKQWEELRKLLSGHASMPQEQRDSILASGRSGKLYNKKGDIFLRPERVFQSGKRKGRF